jgi:sugar/nucleoside kinase (ribokinase family)
MVPEHCLIYFVNKFGSYPLITKIRPPFNQVVYDRMLGDRYHTIWYERFIDEEGVKHDEKILKEFDSTGICLYLNDKGDVFILSTNNKQDIVDYTTNELKKIK